MCVGGASPHNLSVLQKSISPTTPTRFVGFVVCEFNKRIVWLYTVLVFCSNPHQRCAMKMVPRTILAVALGVVVALSVRSENIGEPWVVLSGSVVFGIAYFFLPDKK